jgi:putative oxidoreductase
VNTPLKGIRGIDLAVLISRLLLAWIFLHEGLTLATHLDGSITVMTKAAISTPLVLATIALQIIAGSLIAFGFCTRLGALALGIFCIMTAVLFHTHFIDQNELLHFEKDLAIAGGMLALAIHGPGRISFDNILSRSIKSQWLGQLLMS